MPVFNILLAQEITHYGSIEVTADTWQDAACTLVSADWWDNCTQHNDEGYDERVVHIETAEGDIVAEDIMFDVHSLYFGAVIHRLTTIFDTCDVSDDTAAALVAYIDELRAMVRDPIFKKEGV